MNRAKTGCPIASIFSRPPSWRSTSTATNATVPPSFSIALMAAMVDSPRVTTSSMTTTVSPFLKFPSINFVWPWALGDLRTENTCKGEASLAQCEYIPTANATGSAPIVSPPTATTFTFREVCSLRMSEWINCPTSQAPSGSNVVSLQSM